MAESGEKYRQYAQYAAECLRIAQHATDSSQKALLLAMAQAWQRLAEQAEQRGD